MQFKKGTKLVVKTAFRGANAEYSPGDRFTVATDIHVVNAGIVHVRPDNKPRMIIEIPVAMCARVFEVKS